MTELGSPAMPPAVPPPVRPPRRRRWWLIALILLVLCSLLVVCPLAAYAALGRATRTFTDERLGFTLRVPLLWTDRSELAGDSYRFSFSPELDLWSRGRQMTLTISPDRTYANQLHGRCAMWLKGEINDLPNGRVIELERRTVAGYPGAEAGYRARDPRTEAWDGWSAVLSTSEGTVWLDYEGPEGSLEELRAPFEQALAGLSLPHLGNAPEPPDQLVSCSPGFDPYRSDYAGLAFCYPASWIVIEEPGPEELDVCQVVVRPIDWDTFSGALYLGLARPEPSEANLSDDEMVAYLPELVDPERLSVTAGPDPITIGGRRAVVVTFESEAETDGVTGTYSGRTARILDDEWDLMIFGQGPKTGAGHILQEFDRVVQSLILLSPDE